MPDRPKGPEIPPELLKAAIEQARQEIQPLFASFFGSLLKEVMSDASLKSPEDFIEALKKRVQPAFDYAAECTHSDVSPAHLKIAFTKAEFQKWLDEKK